MSESRPQPNADLPAEEFVRWYWLKSELREFAGQLGVSGAGSKAEITQRIVAELGGKPQVVPEAMRSVAARGGVQLQAPMSLADVVPPGQRCSKAVREFMVEQVGPGFRFDGHMRKFFADPNGRTLGDAVEVWHRTRGADAPGIAAQFEYNTFVRDYRQEHPGASHQEVVTAWRDYRDTPVDRRPTSRTASSSQQPKQRPTS